MTARASTSGGTSNDTRVTTGLLAVCLALLSAGGVLQAIGSTDVAAVVWTIGSVLGLFTAVVWMVIGWRHGTFGVDVVAALALAGTLVIGQPLAGTIIAVMLTGGRWLEARAGARSRRELALLVERAPRRARRIDADIVDIAVSDVVVGDVLLVGSGEIVPVDGRLVDATLLDESALTGEPMPIDRTAGEPVRSGVVNVGAPSRVRTTAVAAESSYAAVVRLAEQAQASTAPFVRTADRVAAVFVPFTLLTAAVAWALGGTFERAVAVLVVATPCPLLLAAPIAIMSGMSRAASMGVVIKGGDVLERLAYATVLLLDKTGTITRGRPELTEVLTAPGVDTAEVLGLAAALEQASTHPLAGAVIGVGSHDGITLPLPGDVREHAGSRIEGVVSGRHVAVGQLGGAAGEVPAAWITDVRRRADLEGRLTVWVVLDGLPSAAIIFDDVIRPEAPAMVRSLRAAGIARVVLATGDRPEVAEPIGRLIGADEVIAGLDPAGKLAVVRRESAKASTIMVGDGINDAPALAAAGVGVALAARGATASSEAADVVLTVDRIDVLTEAVVLARRTRAIAWQSVLTGMGLSVVAMGFAAFGLLTPVPGAAVQEAIDLLAIVVALRNLRPGRSGAVAMSAAELASGHGAGDRGLPTR